MPYNAEPGQVAYVVSNAVLNHGQLAALQGFAGEVVKTQTPAADTPRSQRAQIANGEACLLFIDKVVEAPASGVLAGVAKGALVWIVVADNTLSLTTGAGKLVLGKVCSLPGERGTPSTSVRINLGQKVA